MPTHYQGKPHFVRALDAYIKLTRAASSLETRLMRQGSFGDLTPSQFGVMETLYHLGPLTQGEISNKLLKSSANITLVIDNLEKRGLVQRKRNPQDRRCSVISLTPAGEEQIDRLFPAHAAAITAQLAVMPPEEQETLSRLCRKLGRQETA